MSNFNEIVPNISGQSSSTLGSNVNAALIMDVDVHSMTSKAIVNNDRPNNHTSSDQLCQNGFAINVINNNSESKQTTRIDQRRMMVSRPIRVAAVSDECLDSDGFTMEDHKAYNEYLNWVAKFLPNRFVESDKKAIKKTKVDRNEQARSSKQKHEDPDIQYPAFGESDSEDDREYFKKKEPSNLRKFLLPKEESNILDFIKKIKE